MPCEINIDEPRNQGSGPGCVEFCVFWPLTYSENGTVIEAHFSEVSQTLGEVLFIFGSIYILVCSSVYWWLRRTSTFLQSRGSVSIALICVGLFPQLLTFQYREMVGRHKYNCIMYIWGQLIVYASFNTPYIVRTLMVYYRYQYKRLQVSYWGRIGTTLKNDDDPKEVSMKKRLARLKRKTTEFYGFQVQMAFLVAVHLGIILLVLLQPEKYKRGCNGCENHKFEIVLLVLANSVTTITALWALYKVKGEKDPLHLVSELRVTQIVNFCFIEPILLIGLWDPGHFGRKGVWLWAHISTIGQLAIYSHTIPYQAYKSLGYNKNGELEEKSHLELQTFLSDMNAGAFFVEYLVTEFSSENFFFYKRVQEWKSKKFVSEKAMFQEATHIVRTFLDVNSPLEVNITGQTRTGIEAEMANGNITVALFDSAADEIYSILKDDSFPRFLRSEVYFKFTSLASLGEKSHTVIVKNGHRLKGAQCCCLR